MNKSRIFRPERYLKAFQPDDLVRIGVKIQADNVEQVCKLGFSYPFEKNVCLLPPAINKPLYENAEGKYTRRKDLPMETAFRYFEWTWEDYNSNAYWDSKYVPYKRYVRDFSPPLALELSLLENEDGELHLVTEPFRVGRDREQLKLSMNIFISVFGDFMVFFKNLREPIKYIRRVTWEILRPGHHSDEEVRDYIEKEIGKVPSCKQSKYRRNIAKLQKNCPEVISIGTVGFSGYIVFCYPEKNLAVLESLMPDNATYILESNWEEISQYTKTQVLDGKLHKDRIIHCDSWDKRIDEYLN